MDLVSGTTADTVRGRSYPEWGLRFSACMWVFSISNWQIKQITNDCDIGARCSMRSEKAVEPKVAGKEARCSMLRQASRWASNHNQAKATVFTPIDAWKRDALCQGCRAWGREAWRWHNPLASLYCEVLAIAESVQFPKWWKQFVKDFYPGCSSYRKMRNGCNDAYV